MKGTNSFEVHRIVNAPFTNHFLAGPRFPAGVEIECRVRWSSWRRRRGHMWAERRIVNVPLTGHQPGLSAIEPRAPVVWYWSPIVRIVAPFFAHLGYRRLNEAPFIRAAGVDHSLCSVPIPGQAKPGMRAWKHWLLKLRVLPGLAA